jgi:hypothetical protein
MYFSKDDESEATFMQSSLASLKHAPRTIPWPAPVNNKDATMTQLSDILSSLHSEFFQMQSANRHVVHALKRLIPKFRSYPPWFAMHEDSISISALIFFLGYLRGYTLHLRM